MEKLQEVVHYFICTTKKSRFPLVRVRLFNSWQFTSFTH